jgi:hypothetical protein
MAFKKYMRHSDVSKWIYENVGKASRNLDGVVELNNKPVTKKDIYAIYNQLKRFDCVLSRVEDCLKSEWFDYRYGGHQRFADTGWIAGEKYTLLFVHDNHYGVYKVHRTPRSEICVRKIFGGEVESKYFIHKSEAINYFNSVQNEITLTESQFYH